MIEWERLSSEQQAPYDRQAEYLLEHNYVSDMEVEELAKILYQKNMLDKQ